MSQKKILVAVVALAAFLRFYQLGKNPPSLNLDEVAIGYNAYSILKTGRDEYRERFPLAFRSHDDYKPPLYVYLTTATIAAFDLTPLAVRFPSALLGTLTIPLTYFLTGELLSLGKKKESAELIALLASAFLAINPWHLQFSRAGFETNVAVFFIAAGLLAFLNGMKGSKKWLSITAICFAAALYTYQSARIFVPLLSISLLFIFRKELFKAVSKIVFPSFIFLILILPLLPVLTSPEGMMRFKGTSVFEHPGLIEKEAKRAVVDAAVQDGLSMKLFHNRPMAVFLTLANGYLKHFAPDMLFLGMWGPPLNYTPNVGLLYLFELPLVIWGAHELLKDEDKRIPGVVFIWILLAPVAAALTIDVPSSTRIAVMLPALQILSAMGAYAFIAKWLRKEWSISKLRSGLLTVVVLLSLFHYLHQYYVHAPIEYAQSWQYGYQEAVDYAVEHLAEYDKVVVSTNLRQPQNFFAFYSKYDPWTYIFIDGGTVSGGFNEDRNHFGKFEFHPIDYHSMGDGGKTLIIDIYKNMDADFRKRALKVISLPNGEPEIAITPS